MVREIIDAVSIRLYEAFGEGYAIHAEYEIRQGLQAPCFYIAHLTTVQVKRVGRRYHRRYSFDVHFFPEGEDRVALAAMGERLFEVLEYIQMVNGDLLRGKAFFQETVDNVLHVMVDYDAFLADPWREEAMGTMDVSMGTMDRISKESKEDAASADARLYERKG